MSLHVCLHQSKISCRLLYSLGGDKVQGNRVDYIVEVTYYYDIIYSRYVVCGQSYAENASSRTYIYSKNGDLYQKLNNS